MFPYTIRRIIMSKHKHLTLEERGEINSLLNQRASFKEIGLQLGKDPTTISKEIRNHRILKKTGALGKGYNNCKHRKDCIIKHLCNGCKLNRNCWSCTKCNTCCTEYEADICTLYNKPPYVCNGCDHLNRCTLEKWKYFPTYAHDEYKGTLSEIRQGIHLSEQETQDLDAFISPLIKKGQSLYHIITNNLDTISVSQSTIYRLIDYNVFNARNIDLPRKVRYSKRKKKKHHKVDKACRINRSFQDYQDYHGLHSLPITEMDSVEGTKGGKVLLTIHFVKTELMLAFIRDRNTSQSVIDVFNNLETKLGVEKFNELMPTILTDNGTEFSNPSVLESSENGTIKTKIFYCDPSAPQQKGSAERNHEFIRYFIPKGQSLDFLTQHDVALMMNHINSCSRKSLAGKSPYDVFSMLYGDEVLNNLGCVKIQPNDVILNKILFNN